MNDGNSDKKAKETKKIERNSNDDKMLQNYIISLWSKYWKSMQNRAVK